MNPPSSAAAAAPPPPPPPPHVVLLLRRRYRFRVGRIQSDADGVDYAQSVGFVLEGVEEGGCGSCTGGRRLGNVSRVIISAAVVAVGTRACGR